jgi:zinc/manganese transport system substrate-binding protein
MLPVRRRDVVALPLAAASMAARRARALGTLPVIASSILADMVRQIGGARVEVRALVGPDADAHAFQPRPSDAEALHGARLVVRNRLGFEPWLGRLRRAAGHGGPVATATEGIEPRAMQGDGHDNDGGATGHRGHGAPPRRAADPHAWQDLRLGQAYARNIGEGLAAADPDGAEAHRRNAEAYAARLATLDAWVHAQVETVPAPRRKVVTGHGAFGYFAAAYGVAFLAPRGVRNEPSAAAVAALVRQVRAEGITAVFVENLSSNREALRRLAAEAGVRVRQGRLYADALSPPDGPAPTYEAMFRHNVGLLVPAMRGDDS